MLAAMALAASIARVGSMPVVFPCTPGKVLTYKVKAEWHSPGGDWGDGAIQELKATTQFKRCRRSLGEAAALVRGLPLGLTNYMDGQYPGYYAIIQTARGLYIKPLDGPHVKLERIKPSPANLYVGFPVKPKQCAEGGPGKPKGMYCWFADSVKDESGRTVWNISYATYRSGTFLKIVPGVGIVSYNFGGGGPAPYMLIKAHLVKSGK